MRERKGFGFFALFLSQTLTWRFFLTTFSLLKALYNKKVLLLLLLCTFNEHDDERDDDDDDACERKF